MMSRQFSYTSKSKKVKIRCDGLRKILTEGTQGSEYALSGTDGSDTTANVNSPNVHDDVSSDSDTSTESLRPASFRQRQLMTKVKAKQYKSNVLASRIDVSKLPTSTIVSKLPSSV